MGNLSLREGVDGRQTGVLDKRRQTIRGDESAGVDRDGTLEEERLTGDGVDEVCVVTLDVRVLQLVIGQHHEVRLSDTHTTPRPGDRTRRHVLDGGDRDTSRVHRRQVSRPVCVAKDERERVVEDFAAEVMVVHVTSRDLELRKLDDRVAERERPEASHQLAGRGRSFNHEHDGGVVRIPVSCAQYAARDLNVASLVHAHSQAVRQVRGAVVGRQYGDGEADVAAL